MCAGSKTPCCPPARSRARVCSCPCRSRHSDTPTTLSPSLSRRALVTRVSQHTGCTSLADIKTNRLELVEKATFNAIIVSALVARGAQRLRTA